MRLFPLLVCTALALAACRKPSVTVHRPTVPSTLVAGTFISTGGTFTHADATITRELTVTPGAKDLTWHLRRTEYRPGGQSSGGYGKSMPLPATGNPWFIFVESPDRLWFYDGSDKLTYHLSHSGKGVDSAPAILDGKLRPGSPPIPAMVSTRLPAGLQMLVQPEVPPTECPSF